MDPLSDFTALSPHANEPSLTSRRDDSEEVTSQQCSADPNAFAGLRRPLGVVVASRVASFPRYGGGGSRVSMDVGAGGASQMSQGGSQYHDALLEDTQQDEEAAPSPRETKQINEPKGIVRAPQRKDDSGRGFLSALEKRLPKNGTSRDGHGQSHGAERTIQIHSSDADEEEAMNIDTSGDGGQRDEESLSPVARLESQRRQTSDDARGSVVVVNSFIRSIDGHAGRQEREERNAADALESDTESEAEHGTNSDTDSDYHAYRRDSMDSIPETQPLDEYYDDDDEHPAESIPSTEVFPNTIDQDAMLDATASVAERDAAPSPPQPVSRLPITPPNEQNTQPMAGTTSVERKTQSLKRKQKVRETLQQDPDAFVDTEDQTLTELAARVRRERETQIQAVKSLTSPTPKPHHQERGLFQDESQEDLTSTQPSKASPEGMVHVALKKRGKANPASVPELSASQEKSYEFVDSACRCGEAVCVCAGVSSPVKPSVRPSSAIRNLEFSFAIPESQESESQSQLQDSLPDVGALAMKTLQAAQIVQQSKKPAAPIPSTSSSGGHRELHEADALEATPKKARRTKESSPSSVAGTPPTSSRKRGRTLFSPDAGAHPQSREVTPRKSSRTDKPPVAPTTTTGSSTPSVRTRARIQSPVPSATRTYASRSKSVFKNARHFCLTGFTGDGLDNLQKLIEDYGGKICQQDVLLRQNNTKVVVIATPISWRKLKFMCAIACGIPVVHPGWIHGCIKARSTIPFDGYCVPSGFSTITGRFECLPVKELDIFKGLRFGIPYDVSPLQLETTKEMSSLIAFILRVCGAQAVQEDLKPSRDQRVDIVLADEYTKACEYYAKKHQSSVKTFAWVTECVILQRFLEPYEDDFAPRLPPTVDAGQRGDLTVSSATIPIGDGVQLRLHIGELLLVDLSDEGDIDHFLLFDVCEIMSIRVAGDARVGTKRKQPGNAGKSVKLQVGVLERRPNSPALRRTHTRIIDLSPEKVKRRVVAVSKADFDAMQYRDETIFYYEAE